MTWDNELAKVSGYEKRDYKQAQKIFADYTIKMFRDERFPAQHDVVDKKEKEAINRFYNAMREAELAMSELVRKFS